MRRMPFQPPTDHKNKRGKEVMVIFLLIFFMVTGCSPGAREGGLLSRNQVLNLNPDADLIELEDGTVYTHHGGGWVYEKDLTRGEKIGVVEKGMATKAPVGAKIYETKELPAILIVEYDGKSKRYLIAMGE